MHCMQKWKGIPAIYEITKAVAKKKKKKSPETI